MQQNTTLPIEITDAIRSQFLATLEMLKHAVEKCPEALWLKPIGDAKYWHIAYHALFYLHLYLADNEGAFVAWHKHRPDYNFLGPKPYPPHDVPVIGEAYTKTDVLEYVQFCKEAASRKVHEGNLMDESGFSWLPFSRFEMHIYSIRHLQQHVGELMAILGQAGINVDWVGTKSDKI